MSRGEIWLIEQTRRQLELGVDQAIWLESLYRGGSDRSYYRVHLPGRMGCVLLQYGDERRENQLYAGIAVFLKKLGQPVPEVLRHDKEHRLVWMQDLGETDLYDWRQRPWPERSEAYRKVLSAVRKLHDTDLDMLGRNSVELVDGFSAKLYEWEQNYFWENFIERVFRLEISQSERGEINEELKALNQRMCELPKCLVHRDFQSRNVMMQGENPYWIDFQGMREGTFFYDLAALLFDPYVEFSFEQRLELLAYYHELGDRGFDRESFRKAFYNAAVQRLLQALGAYGFLGIRKGKKQFLDFIPSGLRNLTEAASQTSDFPQLFKFSSSILGRVTN